MNERENLFLAIGIIEGLHAANPELELGSAPP